MSHENLEKSKPEAQPIRQDGHYIVNDDVWQCQVRYPQDELPGRVPKVGCVVPVVYD